MASFQVVLKNLKVPEEIITLESDCSTKEIAEVRRRMWRTALGGQRCWTIDRRPGLDTCDHLALKIVKINN